ncbi:hypothetical protein OD91_2169 [Lutibacter sp. Hel_I_33_5]|uniref:hypothetical protein n=1 Tax=Lutibacter sp. Hel_I_33_5 TaxID=1566289 RepID=UPI0011A03DEA|nr:hypothetical protein [Lutibacter sp. Hel_I_33_5]TVZ56868.1 hypothetical protein OD91_2169 [Lutibacter sp. Hel_I_33_5]
MKSTAHPRVIERGILTSNYKQEIRNNLREINSTSLFGKKLLVKNNQALCTPAGTILRTSLFFIALVFIVF